MHLAVYRGRPDAGAVVHAHPPVSTAFAVCRRGLETPYLAELAAGLGQVPCTPSFAMLSTDEVPDSVADDRGTWHRVTAVGDSAFRRCSSLREVQLPPTVRRIGRRAFEGCGMLAVLTLPDSVASVGEAAFAHLLRVLSGEMTKNEALSYFGSVDIFCLGPVI